ncbi:MAG: hypothetical protein Q6L68_09965 [Thermostichus sp. DG02_5_bins_236]
MISWPPSKQPTFPLMGGLGSLHHPIETEDPVAQRYFDQGLVWLYGFNREAAVASFQAAIERDPSCALCYWGMAYVLGPNLADPKGEDPKILDLLAIGRTLAQIRQERVYLWALTQRHLSSEPKDDRQQALNYAGAMHSLTTLFPQDQDAATLYAEALMLLSPGQYWTTTGQPEPYTEEILATLESVLTRDPNHLGANHLYIHALEGSPTPERALVSAQRLETLAPTVGHLLHMPAHIYLLLGRFIDAYRSGVKAIRADRQLLQGSSIWRSEYARTYYPHHLSAVQAAAQNQPLDTQNRISYFKR